MPSFRRHVAVIPIGLAETIVSTVPVTTVASVPLPARVAEPAGTVYEITAPVGTTTDQTSAIQTFINGVPDGTATNPSVIRFPTGESGGEYRVQGTITLSNRNYLRLEGPSPTNKAKLRRTVRPPSHNQSNHAADWHIEVWRSNNIVVRNIFIESYHTERYSTADFNNGYATTPPDAEADPNNPGNYFYAEREIAIQVNGSEDVLVEDIKLVNIRSYAWHTKRETDVAPERTCKRCTFQRFEEHFCGGWSGCITAGEDIKFFDSTWEKNGYGGVDLEPIGPNEEILGAELKRLEGSAHGILIEANGINRVNDVVIDDVRAIAHNRRPLVACADNNSATRRQNWTVNNVRNDGTPKVDNGTDDMGRQTQAGFHFFMTDNVSITNCHPVIENTTYMAGVNFNNCGGTLTVTGNNFNEACASLGGAGAVRATNGTGSVTVSGNTRDGTNAC